MSWIPAEEALLRLGTKAQTLYANVSRGRIRAKPDANDPRRSLYREEDVERLALRRPGRRRAEAVAAEAISWGDPVLSSAISTVQDGRLFYRGHDACLLAQHSTFEDIAGLLWDVPAQPMLALPERHSGNTPSLRQVFVDLSLRVGDDLPSLNRSKAALATEALDVLSSVAQALAPAGQEAPLHLRLAQAWQRPEAADCLRQAMVLLADHELNASTFASRICASSGASLSACLLAGLSTLTGPRHGGAWQRVAALVSAAGRIGASQAVRQALGQGIATGAFGHPLYAEGDPRAKLLVEQFDVPAVYRDLRQAGEETLGEGANIDFALCALTDAFRLPENAPMIIFALARSAGWLAHAMEQAESGQLIRPRARYCGPPVA